MAVAVVGEIGSLGKSPSFLGTSLGLLSLAAFGAIGFCHGYLGWKTLHRILLGAVSINPVFYGWMYVWNLTESETLTNIFTLGGWPLILIICILQVIFCTPLLDLLRHFQALSLRIENAFLYDGLILFISALMYLCVSAVCWQLGKAARGKPGLASLDTPPDTPLKENEYSDTQQQ
ncbi:hypothetical protein SDC9_68354 [bioreactor metagenome]|uniref:Uncharacterized protein n=1 Tax=bioreactor metagenome TaxID=1076179 RepID=A0A644Y714_9ZZZZ